MLDTNFTKMKREVLLKRPNVNRLLRYYPNTDLRNSHHGLGLIAKKDGLDLTKLKYGDYVVFINTAKTDMKMYAPGNIVAHVKMERGMKINERSIRLVPQYFSGGQIHYSDALREVILKDFPNAKKEK